MQLRRCDYCVTEYNVALAQCPLCGKPADPNAPIEDETAPAAAPFVTYGGAKLAQNKKRKGDRIPRGMWIASCAVLAVAVLIGAIYFLYVMGTFSSNQEATLHQPDQVVEQEPVEQEPVAVIPEEDVPEDDTIRCTGLTISQDEIVLEEKGGYFFLTVLAEPSDCEEPITFASANPEIAEVAGNGSSCMITAVSPGETQIEIACGDITE